MSALHYGLTPKMKPISPRRSALVAALDVGSSKVACLIARLRPHPPQQVLTRRSHAVEVVGYGHAAARGTKAGGVVNLAQAEEAIRQAVDGAERMASVEIESVVLSISAGRLASDLFAAEISDRRLGGVGRRYRARLVRRQPAFDARGPRRAAFAADRLFDRRRQWHPRSARHARFAVRRRHACGDDGRGVGAESDVGGRALSSFRRGDGGQSLRRRSVGSGRRRRRSRRRRRRHGCRHDDDGGVPRRPLRSFRRFRVGRTECDARYRARFECERRRRRTNQDVLRQRAGRWLRRARHDHRASRSGTTNASRRSSCRARRSFTSSSRASRKFWKWCATGSRRLRSPPRRAAASSSPAAPVR